MDVALYLDDALGGYGYAEKPWFLPHERLAAYKAELDRRGLDHAALEARAHLYPAPLAADADILRFHSPAHVDRVRALCTKDEGTPLDHGPTPARASVERAATHVVGAVCDAARRISRGEVKRAFVPIAGFHHAHREEARNYCLYNDCAIVLSLLADTIAGPVASVDIDVHFGDGVYRAFASDPRILAVDLHEDARSLFPNTKEKPSAEPGPGGVDWIGEGSARGTKLNAPLSAGSGDRDYLAAVGEMMAFLAARSPKVVVLQAGLDTLAGDPMANLAVSIDAYRSAITQTRALADRHADGKLLVLGGGGYRTEAVAVAWCAVTEELLKE
ncbi:acetoin utilization protein AcuC [soil metagenome]